MGPLHGVERGVGSYVAGAELTLLPMNQITRPYGINHFPWPFFTKSGRRKEPLPRHLDTRPSGLFDPKANPRADQKLRLSILKTLSGGFNKGPQVLLCKVLGAPSERTPLYTPLEVGDRIVIKVFDYECYPQTITPYPPEVVADQDLSRGATALSYMHEVGRDERSRELPSVMQLTGGLRLAPEYHGTWGVELDGGARYAGAVAMEFIDGKTSANARMNLYPDPEPQPLYDTDDESSGHGILDMSEESRLKILAYILECFVRGFQCGKKYEDYDLEDFIVTDTRKGTKAWRPHSTIAIAKCGRPHTKGGPLRQRKSDNQRLPRPVHPADHFTLRDLCDFAGWFPYEWWHDEAKFEAWLLKAFGPKIEYDGHRFQRFSLYGDLEVKERMDAAKSLPFANEESIQGLIAIRFSDLSE
ncbi:hypothetical protein RB213_011593 [Colletotrichum asianum]